MAKGLSHQYTKSKNRKGLLVPIVLVLALIAIIIIGGVGLTVSTSTKLTNLDKKDLANIPANILPAYSHTNFISFDEQTNLSGWFFKTDKPISTVILVHDMRDNRLQFDLATTDIIEELLDAKFNVFLFDQRNSGESQGDISGYGYLEWMDLIGAIRHVRDISITKNVILYGVGTGCSTIMQALERLPAKGDYESDYPSSILKLSFDRNYIIGLILDSPAKMADDYIRPFARREGIWGWLMQWTVPYAIRISSSGGGDVNLMSVISRVQVPVCILYGEKDTFIGAETMTQIAQERLRLHPNTTVTHSFPMAKYTESFTTDRRAYLDGILAFLVQYFY